PRVTALCSRPVLTEAAGDGKPENASQLPGELMPCRFTTASFMRFGRQLSSRGHDLRGTAALPSGGTTMERKKASDFPQELLNLFDGYVHGRINRRQFLDGAQRFATAGVTAAALFQMLRPNYARAVQVPPDDGRIKTETVTVPSPQGNGSIKGYLARPANATKLPAILVVH